MYYKDIQSEEPHTYQRRYQMYGDDQKKGPASVKSKEGFIDGILGEGWESNPKIIGGGIAIIILLGFLIWWFYFRKQEPHEEEFRYH